MAHSGLAPSLVPSCCPSSPTNRRQARQSQTTRELLSASRMQTWTHVTSVEATDALCRACMSTVHNPPAHVRHHLPHAGPPSYQSATLKASTITQPTCPPAYLPTHDAITYPAQASPCLNQPPSNAPSSCQTAAPVVHHYSSLPSRYCGYAAELHLSLLGARMLHPHAYAATPGRPCIVRGCTASYYATLPSCGQQEATNH